jgi:uncharacterized protein HemX
MEENTNQTLESTKQDTQKPDRETNPAIVGLLVLIIIILGILIGYQFLKKGNVITTTKKTIGQTTTQETTTAQEDLGTIGQTTQQDQSAGQNAGTDGTIKSNIDADLKTLDELDLSGIENDYGEDQLSDL